MKKFFTTLALVLATVTTTFAMSNRQIRENARFLSDRMAYELAMSTMQYEDCYEINYDFISAIDEIMDDVVYGYQDAIDAYYDLLDWRNDDLRMILDAGQFARFCALEYFYRPIHTFANSWRLRIYGIYTNHSHFYFSRPGCYHTYHGGHSRFYHSMGYYGGRYHHQIAPHYDHFRTHHGYADYHHNDFGHIRHDRPAGYHRDYHRAPASHHDRGPAHRQDRPSHRQDRPGHDSHGGRQPQHRSDPSSHGHGSAHGGDGGRGSHPGGDHSGSGYSGSGHSSSSTPGSHGGSASSSDSRRDHGSSTRSDDRGSHRSGSDHGTRSSSSDGGSRSSSSSTRPSGGSSHSSGDHGTRAGGDRGGSGSGRGEGRSHRR